MSIGIGIITVEARLPRAAALAQQLVNEGYAHEGGPVVNIDHSRHGPWWNFQRVCELLQAQGHTHLCVLEDDVKLCRRFLARLHEVVQVAPIDPLSLFTARNSIVREADKKCTNLLKRYDLDTAQGLVLPAFQFPLLQAWTSTQESQHPEWKFHGDMRIGAWSKARRWPIVHVIPNLVDHDVSIPSTLGHSGKTRYGERVSPRFIDDCPVTDWGIPR